MVISPRPFGQVLNDAMSGLVRTWKALLLPAIAVSVPVSVVTLVVFGVTGADEFLDLVVNNPERLRTLPDEVFREIARPFYLAIGVAALLQLLGGVFLALASHRAAAAALSGTTVTGRAASAFAARRYPAGLGAMLLVVVAVAVLFALGVGLWLVPAFSVGTPNAASVFVAMLLLFALVGPGSWAAVSMSMTTSVVAVEGKGPLVAIRRSMRLVRGRWWATAGFLLLVGLLGGIAVQLIQLIALPLAAAGGGGVALGVASMLGVVSQGLLVAAITAMYTHWYVDLRARRERLSTEDLSLS